MATSNIKDTLCGHVNNNLGKYSRKGKRRIDFVGQLTVLTMLLTYSLEMSTSQ